MIRFQVFAILLMAAPGAVFGHPHEFVDWGAGLNLDRATSLTVESIELQLTWDDVFSQLMLTDFPGIESGRLSGKDLSELHLTYGLSKQNRPFILKVTWGAQLLSPELHLKAASSDGTKVTLTYEIPVAMRVDRARDLTVELYDPTYYTDMGIRRTRGAYVTAAAAERVKVTSRFEQDLRHPYYDGQVLPEEVVFTLRP